KMCLRTCNLRFIIFYKGFKFIYHLSILDRPWEYADQRSKHLICGGCSRKKSFQLENQFSVLS
ncbi:Unknown protein, partial [Striga hermonthica]